MSTPAKNVGRGNHWNMLPTSPLEERIPRGERYRGTGGGTREFFAGRDNLLRSWERARREGRISRHLADRIACEVLQVHPSCVYGPEWFGWEESG